MTASIDNEFASMLKCHACGYRSTLADGLNELNVDTEGAITRLVADVRENDGKVNINFTKAVGADHPITTDYTDSLKELQKNPFPDVAVEFLKRKGCSVDIATKMGCAWVPRFEATNAMGEKYVVTDAVLYPALVRKEGRLICVGAQAREVKDNKWRSKYLTIFKFSSGLYLFGEHLLRHVRGKELLIVEGPLDAMHLLDLGHPAVAVFGVFLSQSRKEKIKRAAPARVTLLPDPDSPGRTAAVRINEQLNKAGIRSRIVDTDKDPKFLTKHDLDSIIRRKHVTRKES